MRTAYLFNRTGASSPALGNNSYPTALSASLSEEQVYHPGLYDLYPATVKVARAVAGVTSKIKFQGTTDTPDPARFGAGLAIVDVIALSSGKSLRIDQATGASQAMSHSNDGGLYIVTLGTNARSQPSSTAQDFADYLTANLPAIFTPTVVQGTGIMGAILQARAVPEAPRWVDIESTREDTSTKAAEHTIDPGAGLTASYGFQVVTGGYQAIRCIATGTGAPNAADAVLVTMGLPG